MQHPTTTEGKGMRLHVRPTVTEVPGHSLYVARKTAAMQRKVMAQVKVQARGRDTATRARVVASLCVAGTHDAKGAKVAPYRSANGGW